MSDSIFKEVCHSCEKPKLHDYDEFHVVCGDCYDSIRDCNDCGHMDDLVLELREMNEDKDEQREEFIDCLNKIINAGTLEEVLSIAKKELRRIE